MTLPSIGVTSPLEHLARQADGSIAAPVDFDRAGWFDAGPQPGQPGPAVIAGHVDSTTGPAVFYRLRDLQPGDPVEVRREDGSVVTFRVTRIEQHPKDEFPSEAVYGPVPDAELRLITCGGDFNRSTGPLPRQPRRLRRRHLTGRPHLTTRSGHERSRLNSMTWVTRTLLPDGSRNEVSMP